MKKFEEDRELRELIRSIKLDKPSPDFTLNVMNRAFQERREMEQIKSVPVFGKAFWIFVILFVLLFASIILLYGIEPSAEAGSIIPDVNIGGFIERYRVVISSIGTLPSSIAGITMGLSLLVLLDKYLNSNKFKMA